jgi:GTPase SAR1 family protein
MSPLQEQSRFIKDKEGKGCQSVDRQGAICFFSYIKPDGIELETWTPIEDGTAKTKPVNFQFWDFAGQDVYYITHQFFINPRAIYLVVFSLKDKTDEIAKVDYWLQSIRSRAENSPIILGTHQLSIF